METENACDTWKSLCLPGNFGLSLVYQWTQYTGGFGNLKAILYSITGTFQKLVKSLKAICFRAWYDGLTDNFTLDINWMKYKNLAKLY